MSCSIQSRGFSNFLKRYFKYSNVVRCQGKYDVSQNAVITVVLFEPPRGKTNNVVPEQV